MNVNIALLFLVTAALAVGGFSYWKSRRFKIDLEKKEKEMERKMYELSILKELGERVGYSLNVQKIIDIITGSLSQFIEYCAVSYMLLEPEKIVFKVHLEKSVSRKFIDDIQSRMLKSLSALLDKEFKKEQVEKTLSGAILVEELEQPVSSFFNIPLAIGDKIVGVLTVAHTDPGLYKEEEMTILYKITKQASEAVSNLQEVVETEQRKLNAMVESMVEGVVMTDKDYRIVVANPAAKSAVNLINKAEVSIFDFIDNLEGKFDIRGKLEESVKLDRVLTVEEVFLNEHFFKIFISPVKSRAGITKGEILGGVVIFHNITREKEVEKMREDFTSMIVHELRSPLDGIAKMVDLVKKDTIKKARRTEYMQMISKNSSDMLELVDNILDAAKIGASKFQIFKTENDVSQVIKERLDFFQTAANDSKIELTAKLVPRLPLVKADKIRISQVLNNFLSNALKYTPAGGQVLAQAMLHESGKNFSEEVKPTGFKWFLEDGVEKISRLDKCLVIAITDSGPGITASDISQLFSKFKQLPSQGSQGKKKGTGLGLVIAKGIVEAHGGIIGVESKEGSGSTFYFTLPLTVPEA